MSDVVVTDAATEAPARRGGDDGGFVLIFFALALTVLMAMAGLGIDMWNWWRTSQEVQRAADAGSLAGVTFLPADLSEARQTAFGIVEANGYDRSQATAQLGDAPSKLRVEVTTTVDNSFVSLFGVGTTTITRHAVAEFNGPTPLGSPVNNLGNQPLEPGEPGYDSGVADPESSNPQVWLQIAGPGNNKENGDRFTSNSCTSPATPGGTYTCPVGGSNAEYTPEGYVFVSRVNVGVGDLGKSLRIDSYDPAFVQTGDNCTQFSSDPTTNSNIRTALAARSPRYDSLTLANNRQFCTGDHRINGAENASGYPTATYRFYQPDNTPYTVGDNTLLTAAGCSATSFRPYGAQVNNGAVIATESPANLDAQLGTAGSYAATVFHRWVNVCDVSLASLGITAAGTYDVPLRISTGNGTGHNRFALRTALSDGAAFDGASTSIFAFQHLPLYQNAEAADSRFYLARVVPSGQNRILRLQLFDVGDGSGTGSITIVPPPDSNLTQFDGCTGQRAPATLTLTFVGGCTLNNVSTANYQAQRISIDVPIPSTYTCDPTVATSCWIRVRFNWSAGVQDTTTWSAGILGDPVRLVQ